MLLSILVIHFPVEAARRQSVFVPNLEETISFPCGDKTSLLAFETWSPVSKVDLELASSQG